MGMVVRSNIMAMNANRSLGTNNSQVSKSLEKLSSGFKINRAGDDAAGLAISEKMKAQIKGLEQASSNSQDGISLVQTAEGALTEVHSMLNRMVELATKSANGTIQDEVDREAIQSEVNALLDEIDRIGDSTNFNGINLLDGSLSSTGGTKAVSAMKFDNLVTADQAAVKGDYASTALSSDLSDAAGAADGDKVELTINYTAGGADKTATITLTRGKDADGNMVLIGGSGEQYAVANGGDADDVTAALVSEIKKDKGLSGNFNISDAAGVVSFESKVAGSAGSVLKGFNETNILSGARVDLGNVVSENTAASDAYKSAAKGAIVAYDGTNANAAVFTVNGKKFAVATTATDISGLDQDVNVVFTADATDPDVFGDDLAAMISNQTGLNVTYDAGATGAEFAFKTGTANNASGGLTLQIGDTGDDFNMLTVSVDDMRSASLGLAGLDVSTADAARASIDTIKSAINKVSTNRANMGALQNRLEHTINNLDVAAENMTAANSRIRDTDMAKEMMEYTKTNVLTQAAQAMLAQANQQPQSILQLLQ